MITVKCNLNLLPKKALCTCGLSSEDVQVTDKELTQQEEEFNQLNEHTWFEEVDRIIQMKIRETCKSKLSLYKLLNFICEICNGRAFLKLTMNRRNEEKDKGISRCSITLLFPLNSIELTHHAHQPTPLHRCIELTLPTRELGRNGHLHKQIMQETGTRIHFQYAPYSSNSASSFKVKITGDTNEAIDNTAQALEKLDQGTQIRLACEDNLLQE